MSMMTLGTVLREIQRQASQHPKNTVTLTLNEYAFLTDFINRPDIDLIDQKATAWDKLTERVEQLQETTEFDQFDEPEDQRREAMDNLVHEHLFDVLRYMERGFNQSKQYRKFYAPKPSTT